MDRVFYGINELLNYVVIIFSFFFLLPLRYELLLPINTVVLEIGVRVRHRTWHLSKPHTNRRGHG